MSDKVEIHVHIHLSESGCGKCSCKDKSIATPLQMATATTGWDCEDCKQGAGDYKPAMTKNQDGTCTKAMIKV